MITLKKSPGEHIANAIQKAWDECTDKDESVQFEFNGRVIQVIK